MSVYRAQSWIKNVSMAQPAHRDNLGDTSSNGGIMHRDGLLPSTLQLAPQLAKMYAAELTQAQAAQLKNAPRMAPPSFGPGTQVPQMGLGTMAPKPPRAIDEGE